MLQLPRFRIFLARIGAFAVRVAAAVVDDVIVAACAMIFMTPRFSVLDRVFEIGGKRLSSSVGLGKKIGSI